MTLQEEVTAVNHMNKEDDLSTSSICDLLGKSTEWVQKRLMIINLPEDVKSDLMSGSISIKHAEIIGAVEDAGIRAILLNTTTQNKLNTRQCSELARLYMDTPTMENAIQAGLQKAQEIQAQKTPSRSCDYCGELQELSRIQFVASCSRCIEKINEAIQLLTKREDTQKNSTHAEHQNRFPRKPM
jgi:NADH pyrophosphatase NudC (nudix superfamily)